MTESDLYPYLNALHKLQAEQLMAVGHEQGWLKVHSEEDDENSEFYQDRESVVFFRHIDSEAVKCVSSDMLDTEMWRKLTNKEIVTTYLNSGDLVLSVVFGKRMDPLLVGAVDREYGVSIGSEVNWAGSESVNLERDGDVLRMNLKIRYLANNDINPVHLQRAETRLTNLMKECRAVSVEAVSDGAIKLNTEE